MDSPILATFKDLSNLILDVAKTYFPFIREDNFQQIFKLNLHRVTSLALLQPRKTEFKTQQRIRNLLMMLFHCKHYLPIRTACIIFGLERSRYEGVVNTTLKEFYEDFVHLISLDNRHQDNHLPEFEKTFLIVDSTEVLIQSYQKSSFSGKKHAFTVKYQVIIGARTGEILHIYGPEFGSVHDADIWRNSRIGNFLMAEDEFCLGDRGYIGCTRTRTPFKRKKHHLTRKKIPLSPAQKDFNKNLTHYRILIENVNSFIKDWNIVSHIYRGSLETHYIVFTVCCLLTKFSCGELNL
jgi:hypothetical protein